MVQRLVRLYHHPRASCVVNGIGHFLAVLLFGCITDTAQCVSHFLYEILQSLFFIAVGQQHREVYLFFCYLTIHTLSCSVYQILVRHRLEQTSDKSCVKQFLLTHIWCCCHNDNRNGLGVTHVHHTHHFQNLDTVHFSHLQIRYQQIIRFFAHHIQ